MTNEVKHTALHDVRKAMAALNEIEEYLQSRADAEYQGEETGWVGNKEMRLLQEVGIIEEFISKGAAQ